MITKIKLSLWVLLMAFALFTGCNKEDQVLEPTITLDGSNPYTAGNKEVTPDTTLKVKVTALKGTDGKDLDVITVKVSYNNKVATPETTITAINAASKTFEYVLNVSSDEGTELWTFEVKDKDGKVASKSFTLTVKKKGSTTPTAPKEFSSLTLSNSGGKAAFISSSDGRTYTEAQGSANSSKIDIGYFWSPTAGSGNNMASPAAMNTSSLYGAWAITWGSMSTTFKKTNLSATDFNNLDDESKIKGFYDNGTLTTTPGGNAVGSRLNENELDANAGNPAFAPNKVIAFYNGSKYGLILINSKGVAPDGGANIDIKVEN